VFEDSKRLNELNQWRTAPPKMLDDSRAYGLRDEMAASLLRISQHDNWVAQAPMTVETAPKATAEAEHGL